MLTADLINLPYLQAQAGSQVARAGQTYYLQGRAQVTSVEDRRAVIAVRGSQPRPYVVQIFHEQQWLMVGCTCPHAAKHVTCKHIIAAAFQLRDHLIANPPNPWREVLTATLPPPRRRTTSMVLLFSLVQRGAAWALTPYTIAERSLPEAVVADPKALLAALRSPDVLSQAKIPRFARPSASAVAESRACVSDTVGTRSPRRAGSNREEHESESEELEGHEGRERIRGARRQTTGKGEVN